MTAFTEFLANPEAVRRFGNWLVDVNIEDSNGSPVTLRASSRLQGFRTRGTDTPANTPYPPDLAEENGGIGGLRLEASLWGSGSDSVAIGGSSLPSEGLLVFGNRDGRYDQYGPVNGYRWGGREVQVRFGSGWGVPTQAGFMPYEDFRVFFFESGEPRFYLDRVELPIFGRERRFEDPLSRLKYRGTGFCLDFAAGAYGNIGTPAKLDITGNLTLETWAKLDNLSAGRNLVGWQIGASRFPFQFSVAATGALRFAYTHSGGTSAVLNSSTGLVVPSRWYHLVVSVTGTTILFVAYDQTTGAEVFETGAQGAATRDANVSGTLQLSINSGTLSMVGRLDEMRIWGSGRSLSEIRQNRFGEIEVVPGTLFGYYKFNDASGGAVSDTGTGTTANATLSGTTTWMHSLEGESALAGRVKPDRWGRTEYREPILVDPATQTYQVAGAGACQAIQAYEGLKALTLGIAGDVATEKTFINTNPAGGTYVTHLAGGLFKLGSTPTLPITAVVEGYTAGGYADTKSTIIRRIVTARGEEPLVDPDDLDTGSFTQTETDEPALHGIAMNEESSIREALDRLTGIGFWWGYDFDSQKFTVRRWEGPAGTADLVIPTSRILGVEPLGNELRVWRLQMGFGQIREHQEDEVNATLKTGNAFIYQRAREEDGWSISTVEDQGVLDAHPRATSHRANTLYQWPKSLFMYANATGRDAVSQESARLLGLLSQGWEPYKLLLDPIGLQLNLGDTIAPIVKVGQDYRLGFDGTRNLCVLKISVEPESWNVEVIALG